MPGLEGVPPRHDSEAPAALCGGGDLGRPAVEARVDQAHRCPGPLAAPRVAEHDVCVHGVVALAEHSGGHGERLADHGLGRPASAALCRLHIENGDPLAHRQQTYPSTGTLHTEAALAANRVEPGGLAGQWRGSRPAATILARVKAIRRFTVRTVLPSPLAPLGELALNLRWSWHPESQELFRSLEPKIWEEVGHDPV